jgi:hypothetical protein
LKDLIKQEKDLTGEAVDAPGDEDKARQLPKPVGHKILCAVPPAGDTFDDSLIAKASVSQRIEEQTTMRLYENMKTINAYQLNVELENINTTVDCISDTAIANHHIRMSA